MIGFLGIIPLIVMLSVDLDYKFTTIHLVMFWAYFCFLAIFGYWWDNRKMPSIKKAFDIVFRFTILLAGIFAILKCIVYFVE